MRAALAALLWTPFLLPGQVMMDPARLPEGLRNFGPLPTDSPLKCSVTPIKPALNFGFRFQAGYVVRVPLKQFYGPGHTWAVVTRVTPENSEKKPVYFTQVMKLPNVPKTNQEAEIGGGYLLGVGRYRVEWMLVDDKQRVCRKDWKIEVELKRSEREVQVAMAPDTVASLYMRRPRKPTAAQDVKPLRLTVMLHAAPLSTRRTRLRGGDRLVLLGALSSLLERLPTLAVRLVVFNLDQQKQIFRRDGFNPRDLDQVAQALNGLELGVVDYRALQNRRGHVDILTDLVNQETDAGRSSDAVVFLGPPSRFSDKLPAGAYEKTKTGTRFFYFQFQPGMVPSAETAFPDSISLAVRQLKGKTSRIHSPGDLAKAISALEAQVESR